MFPTLIDFGTHQLPLLGRTHLFLPTYGLLFATATVLAWWWFLRRGRTLGVSEERLFNLSFYTIIAGIVGAKLALVLVDWERYVRDPAELWGTLRSAGVLMGGVIAGGAIFFAYARRHGLPLFRLCDAVVAPVAFAQAIGRLGCHAAGCCWGVEAARKAWYSVIFTNPIAREQTGVPLHVSLVATQLIQMVNDLLLALLLAWLWRRRLQPAGTVLWIYVFLYGLTRGIIEFWRGDVTRGLYFGGHVSTSQLIAAGAVTVGLAMLLVGRLRGRHEVGSRSRRSA